jgi:hypothetical protein
MRRLRDFQRVDIYVGHAATVEARVAAVSGDEARLALRDPLPPEVASLPTQTQIAFDHAGHLIMLSGMLHAMDDDLTVRFVVGDGVRDADKRRHARLSVALPAVVTPLDSAGRDAGPPVRTATRDISAGGALLGCGGMPARVRVAIELPGELGAIEARANVVRSTDEVTACAFIALDAVVQTAIERFVEQVRIELARRFAARAAA